MASRFYTVVIDADDPSTLARFWAEVLAWKIVFEQPDEVVIAKDEDTYPGIVFGTVPETKTTGTFCSLAERASSLALAWAGVSPPTSTPAMWMPVAIRSDEPAKTIPTTNARNTSSPAASSVHRTTS